MGRLAKALAFSSLNKPNLEPRPLHTEFLLKAL